ncbi:hypothetical protein RvY_13177 [Ramazzottius varieornatus]|uniref:Uncharacterized protein n=1 Tax=Ramazzottius varieornatus TaxID=947166 RepID=A0A1D1VSD3_RAMVA|nr:hypothetical protein RvY_13177 [Ramazzottius varieornatus]
MSTSPLHKRMTGSKNNGWHENRRSAIVFWHEAKGCPQTVKAIPLSDVEPTGQGRVSEKTICRAKYRGYRYPCIVLWIEDKSAEDLTVSRLLPESNLKIFEEKGLRWAEELGVLRRDYAEADGHLDGLLGQQANGSRHRYGSSSTVEANGTALAGSAEVVEPEAPSDVRLGHPFRESSSMTSSSTGASSCEPSSSTGRHAGLSPTCQPRKQALPRKVTIQLQSNSIQDDGEDDITDEDVGTVTVFKNEYDMDDVNEGQEMEADDMDGEYDQGSEPSMEDVQGDMLPTRGALSSISDIPTEQILKKMVLESSWTKALRVAMMDIFTVEELATSLPHQAKNGMKVLDQTRLNVAKDLLIEWCGARNANQPTRRHLCQAIHNCLISCRTSKYKLKKFSTTFSPVKGEGLEAPRSGRKKY